MSNDDNSGKPPPAGGGFKPIVTRPRTSVPGAPPAAAPAAPAAPARPMPTISPTTAIRPPVAGLAAPAAPPAAPAIASVAPAVAPVQRPPTISAAPIVPPAGPRAPTVSAAPLVPPAPAVASGQTPQQRNAAPARPPTPVIAPPVMAPPTARPPGPVIAPPVMAPPAARPAAPVIAPPVMAPPAPAGRNVIAPPAAPAAAPRPSGPSAVAKRPSPIPESGPVEQIDDAAGAELRRLASQLNGLDYFQVLGLTQAATSAEIKKAFYRESRTYHPDRFFHIPDSPVKDDLGTLYKRITEAYYFLRDDQKRRKYIADITSADRANKLRFTEASEVEQKAEARKVVEDEFGTVPKARPFFKSAMSDLSSGNLASCERNLKMGLTWEPGNTKFKTMLTEVQKKIEDERRAKGPNYMIK
ncbi:MAG: DnaJ domain-containing protein [Myxococcaceae bacterium]